MQHITGSIREALTGSCLFSGQLMTCWLHAEAECHTDVGIAACSRQGCLTTLTSEAPVTSWLFTRAARPPSGVEVKPSSRPLRKGTCFIMPSNSAKESMSPTCAPPSSLLTGVHKGLQSQLLLCGAGQQTCQKYCMRAIVWLELIEAWGEKKGSGLQVLEKAYGV